MALWRPKRGPVLRWGRLAHFVVAAAATLWSAHRGGYDGLGMASAAVLILAPLWELATVRLGSWLRWSHRFGDVVDLIAFVLGWLVAAIVALVRLG